MGRTPAPGLRALAALSNAANGLQAGVSALNGNNAPSAANVNYGASLNYLDIGVSPSQRKNISKDGSEPRS